DLVDHQHPAAQLRDARELSGDELRSRHVMEGAERARKVELAFAVREMRCVRLDKGGVFGRALPCKREELRYPVDADDLSHERGQCEGECAGSAADVERTFVAACKEERAHALGKLACARV